MPHHEDTACPRCGSIFECKMGSITLCHCSEAQLSKDQMAYIAERWQGCLCHQCLLDIEKSTPKKLDARQKQTAQFIDL